MVRPKKRDSQNTRELIIERAATLFASKGYEATSISMIASEVGIGKSAIYAHFSCKEEIIKTIVSRYGPTGVIGLVKELQFDFLLSNPEKAFIAFMNQLITFFMEKKSRLFIDLLRMGCTSFSKEAPLSLVESIGDAKKAGGRIFRKLQQAGVVKNEFDSEFLAWELMAPIIHTRLMYFNSSSTDDELLIGKKLCNKHIRYFIANNFVRKK